MCSTKFRGRKFYSEIEDQCCISRTSGEAFIRLGPFTGSVPAVCQALLDVQGTQQPSRQSPASPSFRQRRPSVDVQAGRGRPGQGPRRGRARWLQWMRWGAAWERQSRDGSQPLRVVGGRRGRPGQRARRALTEHPSERGPPSFVERPVGAALDSVLESGCSWPPSGGRRRHLERSGLHPRL